MSGSTYVAIDGAEFEFLPRRAAKISLLVCSLTSFSAIVFLVRAGVCWSEFRRGDVVLLSFTGMAWTTWTVTCLVTTYARSLPPTQTWLWEATRRVMTYLSILWLATFCLCLTLTSRTFYSALLCSPSNLACDPVEHRIAIEIYTSSATSLLVAVVTSILVSIDLHSHSWLGFEPTPRPLEEGWVQRPLLGVAEGDRLTTGWRERRHPPPVWKYSEESTSEDEHSRRFPLPSYPLRPPSSTSFPPSYLERARLQSPLYPRSSSPFAEPNPFLPTALPPRRAPLDGAGPSHSPVGMYLSTGKGRRKHPGSRQRSSSREPALSTDSLPSTGTSNASKTTHTSSGSTTGSDRTPDTDNEAVRRRHKSKKSHRSRQQHHHRPHKQDRAKREDAEMRRMRKLARRAQAEAATDATSTSNIAAASVVM